MEKKLSKVYTKFCLSWQIFAVAIKTNNFPFITFKSVNIDLVECWSKLREQYLSTI